MKTGRWGSFVVVAVLAGLASLLWPGRSQTIDVPEVVGDSCAAWAADMPAFYPDDPPEGWAAVLRRNLDGQMYLFGPIEGHYWRFIDDEETQICGVHYNPDQSTASAEPEGALLYVVEGTWAELPLSWAEMPQPDEPYRVYEVLLDDAPQNWIATAPDAPGYVYWRGMYDPRLRTAIPVGYWLRHVAIKDFRFDFGDPTGGYAFTHDVMRGIDLEFAPKIKIDAGP